ncbi:MAG: efflux RND transporter periplasmic adaptor subunit [Desulfobacteraceae bacterium]|nr:MAG: efflux RND transporter periplasmic adaptor subunit [Desulfobacteraceae bacterium]
MKEIGKNVFRRMRPFIKFVLVIGVISGALYWFRFAPAPVAAHRVGSGEIVAEVLGTGTLDSRLKATIGTKISGRLEEVLADQGDLVRSGQPVARLEDQDLKFQVEIEEANVASRRAGLERLIADGAYAKAALDLAENNHKRTQRLSATKIASPEEYDRSVEALTSARAGMDRAEAALVEGRKQLISAEKTLEFHRARLADTVIEAPFAGLIVRRDRDPGDIVVPGSSILALVAPEGIWIRASVDETAMAQLRQGQPARILFRSEPDRTYPGKVARLGRETDRETREFLVDVRPDNLPSHWTVGQRADVYIETARKEKAVLLPAGSILWQDGSSGVFVAVKGRARWRKLTLGLRGRDHIEVLGGVAPGEVVVRPADPGKTLRDGQRIALP